MKTILTKHLDPQDAYQMMLGALVPRPIAWISSCNAEGLVNVAPFSFYGGVTSHPPIVGIGMGRRSDGSLKDTARNILEQKEFVVHLCEVADLDGMIATAKPLPPEESELEDGGWEPAPSEVVQVPGFVGPRVRLECRLHKALEVGDGPVDFVMGEVVAFQIAEELWDAEEGFQHHLLQPVGRMGGKRYALVESTHARS